MAWGKGEAYPAARERGGGTRPVMVGQYERTEATAGYVAVADTLTDVFTFSGQPDSISVTVETFDAVVGYRMRGRTSEETFVVRAGQTFAPDVRAEIVQARNNVPGSIATIQVIGKWLREAPHVG